MAEVGDVCPRFCNSTIMMYNDLKETVSLRNCHYVTMQVPCVQEWIIPSQLEGRLVTDAFAGKLCPGSVPSEGSDHLWLLQ